MKGWKTLTAVILILGLLLLIVGCGGSANEQDGSPVIGDEPGVTDELGQKQAPPGAEEPEGDHDVDPAEEEPVPDDNRGAWPKDYNLRIYLSTRDAQYLFPVTFTSNTTTPATVALETLFSTPSSDFASNPVPPGMEIGSLSIQGDVAYLSLKATQPVKLGSWGEGLMAEAIVRTLTQFNNVNKVMLEEAPGSFSIFGHLDISTPASYTNNINLENPPAPEGTTLLRLWFPDADAMFMIPVTRAVPSTQQVARASVHALLQGPDPGSNLGGVFPAGTVLQDIYTEDGTCYVDFNELMWAGDLQELFAYHTMALTLTRFNSIDQVVVTVNGEPVVLPSGESTEESPLDNTETTVNPLSSYQGIIGS